MNENKIIPMPSHQKEAYLGKLGDELNLYFTEDAVKGNSDLVNLCIHHLEVLEQNRSTASEDNLHVIRSKFIPVDKWSDAYGMDQLNKISVFDDVIRRYKLALLEVPKGTEGLLNLKEVSRDVVLSILRTIGLRDRGYDRQALLDTITHAQITRDGDQFAKLLPIYNLIIYSVPFALSTWVMDANTSFEIITFAPYECCAHAIQELNYMVNTEASLPTMLRVQAYLESHLPDVGVCRSYYRAILPYLSKGMFYYKHRYQYLGLGMLALGRTFVPLSIDLASNNLLRLGSDQLTSVYQSERIQNPDIPLLLGTATGDNVIPDSIIHQIITQYP